jgi:pyruvate dehydrogenase E2 component (dihydrolipoamide acetyltransferase)
MQGSGAKGRIVKTDVMAFIKQAMEGMSSNYGSSGGFNGGGTGIPAIPEVDFSKFGEVERVELGRINKISAANLHRAWLNLPMVTHHDSADVTEMEAFRKLLKSEAKEGDAKITGLAFHMKALTKTLKAFPKVNSSLSPDGEALFYKKYFNIGIAVDTPNGLVVPVFKDVDKKSISELAAEMSDMSSRARAKKLKPDEMQGASMTISSLGGIGGTAFTPIVNPPEVAILGITRASMQPVWDGATFIPRLMCPLDLTYDHRVVDGADAARFMAHYIREISDIRRLSL